MAWLPLERPIGRWRLRRAAMGLIAATALGMLTAGSAAAQDEAAAALIREVPDAVDVADCAATPRAAGTISGLLGTTPEVAAILGGDPQAPEPAAGPGTSSGGAVSGAVPESGTSSGGGGGGTSGSAGSKPDVSGTTENVVGSGAANSSADAIPEGLPAVSDEAVAGIAETLRQLTACRFTQVNPYSFPADDTAYNALADYEGAYYALFSDDYFRRNLVVMPGDAEPVMKTSWSPIGPTAPVLRDARLLEDGRVLATVGAPSPLGMTPLTIVFAQTASGWQIDELSVAEAAVSGSASGGQGQTSQAAGAQFLEFCLRDDGGNLVAVPEQGGLVIAGQDVTLTVANIGTTAQRFEVPDLGIALDVPAGHSGSILARADVGTYTFQAVATPSGGAETTTLNGSLEFVPPGTNIPVG